VNLTTYECSEMTFESSLDGKPNPELARLKEIEAQLDSVCENGSTGEGESILMHMMEDDDDED